MKYDKKKAINIVVTAAKSYQTYLQDKNFLIIYQTSQKTENVQVEFRDYNFLHFNRH